MEDLTMVIGLIIKCMGLANTFGQMGDVMKGSIYLIKDMYLIICLAL
jgi:hypothetical protein